MARASSSPTLSSSSQIRDIVGQFVGQLSALIEQDAVSRARETILSAFGGEAGGGQSVWGNVAGNFGKRGRGRPPGRPRAATVLALAGAVRKRRKAPIQLCPVPGCTNRAAPVFGMVCAKHKDLPKAEIRKFREARRARRNKDKGRATRTRGRSTPGRRAAAAPRAASAS
jgi:hypothetical protein